MHAPSRRGKSCGELGTPQCVSTDRCTTLPRVPKTLDCNPGKSYFCRGKDAIKCFRRHTHVSTSHRRGGLSSSLFFFCCCFGRALFLIIVWLGSISSRPQWWHGEPVGGDLGDERLPATPSSSFFVYMSHVVLPADWECDALCQERPYCSKLGTGAEVLFLELLTVLALLSV